FAPGLEASAESLFLRAARLFRVPLTPPAAAIGKNTADCLRSGIMFGYVGLVEGLLERLIAELRPATPRILATGGLAATIAPLTFQAITYRPVEVEMFAMQDERAAGHVAMGREADVVVVAPATAHVLARLAHGFSDDLIATTVLATDAPVIVAPAMETHMWQNPATQANVSALRARGVRVVEPESGPLASGEVGPGRL